MAFVGLVQDLTDSPILVTLVYVAQSLPAFLMSPIAGPVADRFDRRRIIQIVSVFQALAALGLLLVGSAGTLVVRLRLPVRDLRARLVRRPVGAGRVCRTSCAAPRS